nr:MAG TPA: hypothetical protein [Caudoviricetes sp.]
MALRHLKAVETMEKHRNAGQVDRPKYREK